MDLSLLKQKLDTLQSKPQGGGQKTDYTKIFWRPSVGKQQIRIVPSAFDKKNPFSQCYHCHPKYDLLPFINSKYIFHCNSKNTK